MRHSRTPRVDTLGGSCRPHDYESPGLNHVGFVVDDLDAKKKRLGELGFETHLEGDYEPGRRLYFYDPSGLEVELVEYPTDA